MNIEIRHHDQTSEALLRATPTDAGLQRCMGGFGSLLEGLEYAAQGAAGLNFHGTRGQLRQVLTHAELRRQAIVTAGRLRAAGLRRGQRMAILADTSPEFVIAFFACQYAGVLPCPVSLPVRIGGQEAHVKKVAGMLRAAKAHALLTPPQYLEMSRQAAALAELPLLLTHEELAALPERADALSPLGPQDPAYIQYSSGSTAAPKGILISQHAIMANTTAILRHGLKLRTDDRAFSWLPFYHDMGLVGFLLTPVMGQASVDYLATEDFVKRPGLWLRLMSEAGSTVSFAPSFGYALAARRVNGANGRAAALDLSRWRVAGIGGDMVRPEILQQFAEALAPAGFDARAFLPSYGMAEMSLAISFSDLDAPMRLDVIDLDTAHDEQRAAPATARSRRPRTFVSCGRVLPGHELKVVDAAGQTLGERRIGRILVKGPSMMSGYFDNPEATRAVMRDGAFLDTGDLGYMVDGEIFITGRAKDMILHHGRNIWPQDIEWAVEQLPPLRSGDVAAFAIEQEDGEEIVVVLAQCRERDPRRQEVLRRDIAGAVHEAVGVQCRVELVERHGLPQTSSGKLSRAIARKLYLNGELPIIRRTQPA